MTPAAPCKISTAETTISCRTGAGSATVAAISAERLGCIVQEGSRINAILAHVRGMWRTLVILFLLGLLVVSTGANVFLTRQTLDGQTESDRLRQRAVAAEATRGALQSQLDALKASGASAATGTPTAGQPATAPGAPVPTVASAGPDRALLQRIEQQVSQL